MRRAFFAVLGALALMSCDEEGAPVSSEDLATLFATDRHISFSGYRFTGTAHIFADQTFEVNIPALGQDKGRWWLEGDQICSSWEQVRVGEVLCAVLAKRADGSYQGLSARARVGYGTFRFLE